MKQNTMLKVLNPLLGILIINQILTGIFADALPREAFEIMHQTGGFLLAAGVSLHVILNWRWIKANYFKKKLGVKS